MNQRVEVYGTSRPDMNGKRGVAIDFIPVYDVPEVSVSASESRYTVRLDSGGAVRPKLGNVRAERVGATGGVRPKAKGKKGVRGSK